MSASLGQLPVGHILPLEIQQGNEPARNLQRLQRGPLGVGQADRPWLGLLRPADPKRRDVVMLRFLSALDAMARGSHPGEAEWRDLSDAINTVETLALSLRKLDASEVMPVVNAAIAAMVGAANRFKAGHGMRLDAAGLQALRDVVDVYRQCLEGLTEREMAIAQAETQRRVNALLRAKRPNHEVITL